MWFWFVLLGVASGIQLIFEIAVLSMGAVRSWLMEQQFDDFGLDNFDEKEFPITSMRWHIYLRNNNHYEKHKLHL